MYSYALLESTTFLSELVHYLQITHGNKDRVSGKSQVQIQWKNIDFNSVDLAHGVVYCAM